jgi:maltose alpha-D-glucosyltransferase/alpha-amylase
MIRQRKECPEFGWGEVSILETGSSSVMALRYDWRNNSLLTIHNFDSRPQSITVDVGIKNSHLCSNLLAEDHSEAGPDGKHRIVVEAYGYRWFRVGGLQHILKRVKY